MRSIHQRRLSAALFSIALVVGACSGGDESSPADDTSSDPSEPASSVSDSSEPSDASDTGDSPAVDEQSDEGDAAQAGGTLTYAVAAESVGLDPAGANSNIPGGGTGGNELTALYDTLIRYNQETGEFEPRLAESLEPNDDLTVWTLKLRPDITFTDGTPLDADAVTFHLERLANSSARSAPLLSPIAEYTAIDPLTVELTMTQPWGSTPAIFAGAAGMIVSPTAVETLGEGLTNNPVGAGAGPFVFESFSPGESILLKRNADYWGGDVYLDELKFVPIADPSQALQALQTDAVQAAFFRDFVAIDAVRNDDELGSVATVNSSGNTILMNNGVKIQCADGEPAPICEDEEDGALVPTESPLTDPRLRQAVAAAINLDVVNQRVWEGKGEVGSELIWPGSVYYDGVAGPAYDAELAAALVAEVKAEGEWDGTIRFSCHTGLPNMGQAVKAQLDAAGFDVAVSDQQDVQANIAAVIVDKDYDLACFGTTIEDQFPYAALNRDLNSQNIGFAGNWVGYASAVVDQALADLAAATTIEEATTAITTIAQQFTADIPWLTVGPSIETNAWTDNVNGIKTNQTSMVYFDKVWLS